MQTLPLNKIYSTFLRLNLPPMKSYSFLPLPSPYITVTVLTLPPLPTGGTPHNCIIHTRSLSCPRLALPENPLSQVDLTLPVHDSHLPKEAGYAVTVQHEVLEYRGLPNAKSAHVTEFMALTRLAREQREG